MADLAALQAYPYALLRYVPAISGRTQLFQRLFLGSVENLRRKCVNHNCVCVDSMVCHVGLGLFFVALTLSLLTVIVISAFLKMMMKLLLAEVDAELGSQGNRLGHNWPSLTWVVR